jgi:ATP-dependent RNA helicase DDX27
MLKAAIKRSEADKVRHRLVPSEAINAMVEKLDGLKDDVVEVLKEEKEEKAVCQFRVSVRTLVSQV